MANIKGFGEDALIKALDDAGITDDTERAMFLSQMAHETGNFKWAEELSSGKQYEGRADLGNTMPGDGSRYKGRGFIQITGRHNYKHFGDKIGVDLENNPELAKDPEVAAKVAIEYWKERVDRDAARNGDVLKVTKNINGGTNGLEDRANKFEDYYSVMSQKKSPLEAAQEAETFSDASGTGLQEASTVVAEDSQRNLLDQVLFPEVKATSQVRPIQFNEDGNIAVGGTNTGSTKPYTYSDFYNAKQRNVKSNMYPNRQQLERFEKLAQRLYERASDDSAKGYWRGVVIGLKQSGAERELLADQGIDLEDPGVRAGIVTSKVFKAGGEIAATIYISKVGRLIGGATAALRYLPVLRANPITKIGTYAVYEGLENAMVDGFVNEAGTMLSNIASEEDYGLFRHSDHVIGGMFLSGAFGTGVGGIGKIAERSGAMKAASMLAADTAQQIIADFAKDLAKFTMKDAGIKAHKILQTLGQVREAQIKIAGKEIDTAALRYTDKIDANTNPIVSEIRDQLSSLDSRDLDTLMNDPTTAPYMSEIMKYVEQGKPKIENITQFNPVTKIMETTTKEVPLPKELTMYQYTNLVRNARFLNESLSQSTKESALRRIYETTGFDGMYSKLKGSLPQDISEAMDAYSNTMTMWGDPKLPQHAYVNRLWSDKWKGGNLNLTTEEALQIFSSSDVGTIPLMQMVGRLVKTGDIEAGDVMSAFVGSAARATKSNTMMIKETGVPQLKEAYEKVIAKYGGKISEQDLIDEMYERITYGKIGMENPVLDRLAGQVGRDMEERALNNERDLLHNLVSSDPKITIDPNAALRVSGVKAPDPLKMSKGLTTDTNLTKMTEALGGKEMKPETSKLFDDLVKGANEVEQISEMAKTARSAASGSAQKSDLAQEALARGASLVGDTRSRQLGQFLQNQEFSDVVGKGVRLGAGQAVDLGMGQELGQDMGNVVKDTASEFGEDIAIKPLQQIFGGEKLWDNIGNFFAPLGKALFGYNGKKDKFKLLYDDTKDN